MPSKTFVNEKGNKILISVEKTKKSIKVKMEGPNSRTTNTITPEEAKVLKGLL